MCTTNHDSFTSFPSSVFINSCSYLSLPTTIVINHCCLRYRNWTLDGRWQTWKPRKMQRPYLWPGCTSTQAHKSSALCSLVAHQGSNLTHTTPTLLPQSCIAHLNASAPPPCLQIPLKTAQPLASSGMCLYQWTAARGYVVVSG